MLAYVDKNSWAFYIDEVGRLNICFTCYHIYLHMLPCRWSYGPFTFWQDDIFQRNTTMWSKFVKCNYPILCFLHLFIVQNCKNDSQILKYIAIRFPVMSVQACAYGFYSMPSHRFTKEMGSFETILSRI